MIVLTIRTDKPEAEIGLYDCQAGKSRQLSYEAWQAHRQLAETIHTKIFEMLAAHDKQLSDVEGIVAFQGPGSFTGLRIGLTVANAIAYGQSSCIVGATGDNWINDGIKRLIDGETDKTAMPEYGGEANITLPRK